MLPLYGSMPCFCAGPDFKLLIKHFCLLCNSGLARNTTAWYSGGKIKGNEFKTDTGAANRVDRNRERPMRAMQVFLIVLTSFAAGCIPSTIQQHTTVQPQNGVVVPSHVKRIAVAAFQDRRPDREEFPNLGTELQDRLINGLVMNRIEVVERSNLEAILQEKVLRQSGVLGDSDVQSVGDILGVDAILVGEILDYGKIITPVAKLDFLCRLVDVKTGKVIFSLQVNARKTNMSYPFELHREVIEEAVVQTVGAIQRHD